MCSPSFWLARNERRRRSMQAAPPRRARRGRPGRWSGSACRAAGSGRRRSRSSLRRGRCGAAGGGGPSPIRGLRAIICPSSLNCMTAAAFCIRATSTSGRMPSPLGMKCVGGVVGVDRAGQVLQRRERDAVPFVELAEPAVPQRDAQDVADQRLVAEAGPEPGGVVVAPDERDVRLLAEVVDDAVAARAAVPAVAADDQLVDRQVADEPAGEVDQVQHAAAAQQLVDDRLDERPRRARSSARGASPPCSRGTRAGRPPWPASGCSGPPGRGPARTRGGACGCRTPRSSLAGRSASAPAARPPRPGRRSA